VTSANGQPATGGQPTPGAPGQDVRTTLRILWRWKWLFLVILIVIPVAVYLYESQQPKVYRSSALVEVTTSSGTVGPAQPVLSDQLLTVAQIVQTPQVGRIAAKVMQLPPSAAGGLLGQVSVASNTDTGFLTISAEDRDPAQAAKVANAFSHALSELEDGQASTQINSQLKALQGELVGMKRNDPGRAAIQQQIGQLEALKGSFTGGATIIQRAAPSGSPASPETRRTVEISIVIALLLAFAAVLAAESTDRRIRSTSDIESTVDWPLLGVLPRTAFAPDQLDSPREQEAFQMLAAALTYFNVDYPPRSVAVISALMDDGKTTVATGLAVAAARAGLHTVLVDADLRRSQALNRLHVPDGDGLPAALTGAKSLDELLTPLQLATDTGGSLSVLGAGTHPLTPAAVLGSERMALLMTELEQRSDLVVVDTAATLAVGDSLPLLRLVSGVVVVVRLNRSSRVALKRLQSVISSANATVAGVVATGGAGPVSGYGYYYDQRSGPRGLLTRWMPWSRHLPTNGTPPPSTNGATPAASDEPRLTETAPWVAISTGEREPEPDRSDDAE
jgi:polysaccharide biosynthesis transport protein